jgi:hypothetical protein
VLSDKKKCREGESRVFVCTALFRSIRQNVVVVVVRDRACKVDIDDEAYRLRGVTKGVIHSETIPVIPMILMEFYRAGVLEEDEVSSHVSKKN